MSDIDRWAAEENQDWAGRGLTRTLKVFDTAQTPHCRVDGRDYLLFSSSNYLGLSTRPELIDAANRANHKYGTGSGGSRLTTGTTKLHTDAEKALAEHFGSEDCVLFSTGYQTNLSTISAIAGPDVTLFSDSLNHASIIDGCRISRAEVQVFPHGDYDELDRMLKQRTTPHALVLSDAVFSMDGNVIDYWKFKDTCDRNGAWSYLDDAHGVGVFPYGTPHSMDAPLPDLYIGTASKALGAEGGFVCCSQELANYIRNRARSFVFSTSSPASVPSSIMAALPLIEAESEKLAHNVAYCHYVLGTEYSPAPIIPIRIGSEEDAMRVSAELQDLGFYVPAIRFPTVARGRAILRLTVMSTHTFEQIDAVAQAIYSCTSFLR